MREVFLYFLRLGCLGFGGPLALVAQMQEDLIKGRRWMSIEEFRSTFGLIKSMPGPVAFQTAVYLGRHRAGFLGGFLAGFGIVFPSFVMMVILAAGYSEITSVPWMQAALDGMKVGALALIVMAIRGLSQGYHRSLYFVCFLLLNLFLLAFYQISEPILILGSALFAVLLSQKYSVQGVFASSALASTAATGIAMSSSFEWSTLIGICLKAGAFVFGTGLAIVPLLEKDFVQVHQWLTHAEFMDAISFGQLTPGPVVITVTFIGYKLAGIFGAFVATVAIFLPSFVHMTTWFPRMTSLLLRQRWIRSATLGITSAVIAAIILSVYHLFEVLYLWQKISILIVIAILAVIRVPTWLVIVGSSLIGIYVQFA